MMKFHSRISHGSHDHVQQGFSMLLPATNRVRDARAYVLMAMLLVLSILSVIGQAVAGEAKVVGVGAEKSSDGTWRFDVAVLHTDAGLDHYADKWAVFSPDGEMLGERILLHPHDDEQPFTRSQSGIVIPQGLGEVVVRAHDNVHGWGSEGFVYRLIGTL